MEYGTTEDDKQAEEGVRKIGRPNGVLFLRTGNKHYEKKSVV
jgi:hypothetical protein